jgi:molybdenum cofactor cytidylyltransferase
VIFARLKLQDAEGAVLAHAVRAGDLGLLKKGHLLNQADLAALKEAGETHVLAARLEPGDVDENIAAGQIAEALTGTNCLAKAPFTGRANIAANKAGVAVIDRELLLKINTIDPSITVATVKHLEDVAAGQLIATIKIIPFSTPEEQLTKALGFAALSLEKLIRVAPYHSKKIAVLSTRLDHTPDKMIKKSERIMAERLQKCGNRIDQRETVRHHEDDLCTSLQQQIADGCDLLLIFGASAITDIRDVIPHAIEMAGGSIEHFGMPVDPGNLLLLGHIGSTTVVGLPGCTRSPRLNGFDWILQRLLADIPVTARDIMGMGEGGLLKEITSRPQPRDQQLVETEHQKPVIAALLLAAGQSRRMGSDNKLLAIIDGKPMLRHVAETLQASNVDDILMVTGHDADNVVKAVWDLGVPSVQNPDFAEGLSTSLKVGFEILSARADAIVVCLGDMPFVTPESLNKLIEAFDPAAEKSIVVPTTSGKRGNPVLLSVQYLPDVMAITGDMGAKAVINSNDHAVEAVEIDSSEIFTDIDTPEILAALTRTEDS